MSDNIAGGSLWIDLWFVDDGLTGPRRVLLFTTSDNAPTLEWREVEEGAQTEPSLRLPAQAVEELRRALDQHGPLTADNLTFVRDVVGVRDRLLALVETLATGRP